MEDDESLSIGVLFDRVYLVGRRLRRFGLMPRLLRVRLFISGLFISGLEGNFLSALDHVHVATDELPHLRREEEGARLPFGDATHAVRPLSIVAPR